MSLPLIGGFFTTEPPGKPSLPSDDVTPAVSKFSVVLSCVFVQLFSWSEKSLSSPWERIPCTYICKVMRAPLFSHVSY